MVAVVCRFALCAEQKSFPPSSFGKRGLARIGLAYAQPMHHPPALVESSDLTTTITYRPRQLVPTRLDQNLVYVQGFNCKHQLNQYRPSDLITPEFLQFKFVQFGCNVNYHNNSTTKEPTS